jgi:hypothetical protein
VRRIETVIPTRTKDKLRSSIAYPVGAERVTDALSSVPQIAALELWFIANRYGRSMDQENQLVFAARYKKDNLGLSASHSLDQSGFYGPKWDVWVYAVPRQLTSKIRSCLIEHGFDYIRDWFSCHRTDLWLSSSHECTLWYASDDNRLIAITDD